MNTDFVKDNTLYILRKLEKKTNIVQSPMECREVAPAMMT